jgi:outer membrane protein TolC
MRSPLVSPIACLVSLSLFSAFATSQLVAQMPKDAGKLTLHEAVVMALEKHPSLLAARAGEEEKVTHVGVANSARYPQLSTQATLTQYQKPMLVAPLHGFDFAEPPQFEKTLIRAQVDLGFTLYDGGARRSRISGAEAEAAGATARRSAAEMMLTSQVSRAYLEVLTSSGVLDARLKRMESLNAERRRIEQLLTEGRAARVELLRVESSLAQAEAERVEASARLELAERELARVIDVPVSRTRVKHVGSLRLKDRDRRTDLEVLLGRANAANPEVERSRRQLEAAEAEQEVASATWYPQVDLSGGYLAFSSSAGDVSTEWLAGLRLSYPLYTGGARSSGVAGAHARTRRAREELRLAELQVEKEVDRALTIAVEIQAVVAAFAKGVQHQTEVARIEQLLLEAGAGTQTDYLRAEADLARARSALVEARHAEISAWIELARVMGELTPLWLEENLEIVQ